tara:strand:+ start:2505 stop:2738 length:234 start_codon:yes stop_codon:yes gene_type:complete
MSIECVASRLSKLRKLRDSLCEKEKNWQEAFAMRDWIVDQLKILKSMTSKENTTKEDISNRLDDLLCALDPGDSDER